MAERYQQRSKDLEDVKSEFSTYLGRTQPGATAVLHELQRLLPIALIAVAVFLWLISLPVVKPRDMTDIGLLSVLPVTYYLGLIVLTASFSYTVFRHAEWRWLLFLHVLTFIVMIHATPAILYGTLRYSWAWKHVGITDYIMRHGSVNPNIDFFNAYHNWPGFFALNALITQAAGLSSALDYASWATLFFNLMFFGALLTIYRSLTTDSRLIWLSVWFFFLTDWIGQDYFAPQSFGYFFYLVIIGILLRWFAIRRQRRSLDQTMPIPAHPRRGLWGWLAERISEPVEGPALAPAQRVLLLAIVIVLMASIVFSHQLTPFMLLSALLMLVLFGVIYPRSLPFLMGVMVLAWVFFVATPFTGQNLNSMLSSFGTVKSNVSGNLINLHEASTGQVVIAIMGRGLTLMVIFLAAAGFLRRLRKGHFDLAAMLLVVIPFPMLVANNYGGEILFRIYFFALPFMAFFLSGLFLPTQESGRSLVAPVLSALLSVGIIVAFLFAYYGKEKQYYFTPEEVAAANYLYGNALPGSLLIEGTGDYPARFRNYELYTYVPIDLEPTEAKAQIIANPASEMQRWMGNRQYPAAYIFITRSMMAEVNMVGSMPAGSLESITRKLMDSDKFKVLYSNQDAVIFVLKDRGP